MTTKKSRGAVRMGAALALGGSILAGTPMMASADGGAMPPLSSANNPDWMKNVPDSTNLSAMSLPGTHESLARRGGPLTECQENWDGGKNTTEGQLRSGIRVFDVRVRVVKDNKLAIHHSSAYQNANFDDVLSGYSEYLKDHPSETVMLRLKDDYKDQGGQKSYQDIFDDYVKAYPDLFWGPSVKRDAAADNPKLGDVRGKVVLAVMQGQHGERMDNYGLGQFSGWNYGSSDLVQDDYNVPTLANREEKADKVRKMLDHANSGDPDKIYMNFTSGSSGGAFPKDVANVVNPETLDYLKGHPDLNRTGAVMMDFPGPDLVNTIVSRNPH